LSPHEASPHKRRGLWWKVPLIGVGSLLLLVLMLLGVALSDWGVNHLSSYTLKKVNAQLKGHIELGHIHRKGLRITLDDVGVFDPAGKPVVQVERLVAHPALGALLHGQVHLYDLIITDPRVQIHATKDGTNFSDAFTPKHPQPQKPQAPQMNSNGSTQIVVDNFALRQGSVRYSDPTFIAALKDLNIHAKANVTWPGGPLNVDLRLDAVSDAPVNGPLSVRLAVAPTTMPQHTLKLSVAAANSAVKLGGTFVPDLQTPAADLHIERAELSPELANVLAPGSPLITPVNLTGNIKGLVDAQRRPQGTVNLTLSTQGGDIDITAGVAGTKVPSFKAHIEGGPLDLARIIRGAASSQLSVRADAQGHGSTLADLDGTVRVALPPGKLAGRTTGPIYIDGSIHEGTAHLKRFDMQLPGLAVTAQAHVAHINTAPSGSAQLDVVVSDFAQVARTIAATGAAAPPLSGHGQLHLEVAGSAQSLNAIAQAHFSALGFADVKVSELNLKVSVPSLAALYTPTVQLNASRVQKGDLNFSDVRLTTSSPGSDQLAFDLRMSAPVAAGAAGQLTWRTPGQSFRLDRLLVRYPQTVWRSQGPAEVALGDVIKVHNLALQANHQGLSVDLTLADQTISGKLGVNELNLAQLGRVLGPKFSASGTLSLHAEAQGRLPRPQARVVLQMQNAGFGTYGPFTGSLGVTHEPRGNSGRARGSLKVSGAGAEVQGSFDVPATWPWPAQMPATVNMKAQVPSLALAASKLGVPKDARPEGSVTMNIDFRGRAREPTLKLNVQGHGLKIGDQRVGDLALLIDDDGVPPLSGSLNLRNTDIAHSIELNLDTHLRLSTLLRGTLAQVKRDLRDKPVRFEAHIKGLDLAQLIHIQDAISPPAPEPPGLAKQKMEGLVDFDASLSGTAMAPGGDVSVVVTGARQGSVPPTDAKLNVALKPKEVTAKLEVFQRGRDKKKMRLLALDATARIDEKLRLSLANWQAAKFNVSADLGPIRFQHLDLPGHNVGTLRGSVDAQLLAHGTFDHPYVDLVAHARNVRAGDGGLGNATVKVLYENDQPSVEVVVRPTAGGILQLAARTQAAFPWQKGSASDFKPSSIALKVDLTSQDFALSAFNGLMATVREIKGKLNGKLTFAGTVDKPDFSGKMKLDGGQVDIVEVGRFYDIGMDVGATEDSVKLQALRFRSGSGKGLVRFEAKRNAGRGVTLSGNVDLTRMPLQSPQRKLGEISLQAKAKGTLNADGLRIEPLEIEEMKAFLEGDTPKDLQDLDRPDDVVMVRNGEPIDDKEKKKLAKLGAPKTLHTDQESEGALIAQAIPTSMLPVFIHVKAPRNLWVYAPEGSVELGLDPDFQIVIDGDTKIFGTVYLRRGSVTVLGRRFDIQDDASIRFGGPSDLPNLDVTVEHYNETEQVRVFVTVKGTPENLDIKFRSDPEHSESEIITLLIAGRIDPAGGSSESPDRAAQAASIVGGLLASKLQKTALRKLPIDVLSISSNAIEAGTYVTDDFYVGYVRRLAASPWRYENVNAIHLEYQLSERWSFEGEYGDAGTGTADIIWKKRY